MKTFVLILAVLFVVSLAAKANPKLFVDIDEIVLVTQNDNFIFIKFEDLAENVQASIKDVVEKNIQTIKEVLQHKESKDLKVVAHDAENIETTYLFDENGKLKSGE